MLKRLLSVAMSLMLLATTAIATPAMAAGSAPVDISAPLDGFSKQELETTYTKDAPYTTEDGFKAPTGRYMTATLKEDDTVSDYIRIVPSDGHGSLDTAYRGGAGLYNDDIKIGTEHMVFTTSVTFRQNKDVNLRWFFYNANGEVVQKYPLRWWGGTGGKLHAPLVASGGSGYVNNQKLIFELSTWYTVTYTMDLNNKTFKVVVDGGKFDNVTWYATLPDANVSSIISAAPLAGVGIGYLDSGVDSTNYLDIADMTLSTSGSTAYDEKLTFENGTFADSESSNWANGNWSAAAVSSIVRDKAYFDSIHKNAVKLTPGGSDTMTIVNTIPTASSIGNDGTLVAEASYYEHNFAQVRIKITGVNSAGTAETLDILTFSGANWNYSFCGAGAQTMPACNDEWRRVRAVADLKNDKVTLETWRESNPGDASKRTYDESYTALIPFEDITSVTYTLWPRTWSDGRYMAIDDFRVYEKDAIRYTSSTPADNTQSRVALDVKPMMEFNMPIADSAISDITVTLEDSKGNQIDGTASLSPSGYGIIFTPDDNLSPEMTYTYTIDGTLTDVFGQTFAIDKSISFSTSAYIKLKDCTFKQGGTIVTQSSELTCGSAISATVKLAPNYGSVPVTLLLGLYEANTDIMVDAKAVYISALNDTTQTLTLTKPMVAGFDYYPAVFVWSGVETAVPYMEYISLK